MPDGFTTATAIEHQRRNTVFITTGCKAFDDLLGGAAAARAQTQALNAQRRCAQRARRRTRAARAKALAKEAREAWAAATAAAAALS